MKIINSIGEETKYTDNDFFELFDNVNDINSIKIVGSKIKITSNKNLQWLVINPTKKVKVWAKKTIKKNNPKQ